jgi:hypothetical protein
MGISKAAAGKLADQILGIPKDRNTKITADVAQASAGISGIQKQLNGLTSKVVSITTKYQTIQSGGSGGRNAIAGFASGGYTGHGSKFTPAGIVHAGEFVFPQEAVKRLGVGMLGSLAGLPGYAGGGPVLTFNAYTAGLNSALAGMNAAQNKTVIKSIPMPAVGSVGGGAGRWLGTVLRFSPHWASRRAWRAESSS